MGIMAIGAGHPIEVFVHLVPVYIVFGVTIKAELIARKT
jgi:hypothetical protein